MQKRSSHEEIFMKKSHEEHEEIFIQERFMRMLFNFFVTSSLIDQEENNIDNFSQMT